MNDVLLTVAAFSGVLRTILLAGGLALTGVAALDWASRTRRISPFSPVSRFLRNSVDSRLAGIDRQVTRMGGSHTSTPWWAVVVYIVIALALIALVDMLGGFISELGIALSSGPTGILYIAVSWITAILRLALLIRVVSSWLPRLAYSRWVRWTFRATDWMLVPLRRVLPSIGPFDISPIVAYFALGLLGGLLQAVLAPGVR